ncbi:hypothetical protein LV779_34710 [Streptomyces thinghirensis]|nr:hypothetical protein [Streptomyces thinghirensis]
MTLFRPVWREADAPADATAPAHTARLVLACGFADRLDELRGLAPEVVFLEPPEQASTTRTATTPVSDAVTEHAVELLRAIRGLLAGKPTGIGPAASPHARRGRAGAPPGAVRAPSHGPPGEPRPRRPARRGARRRVRAAVPR